MRFLHWMILILSLAPSAFAGKARLLALANSPHLIDPQSALARPLMIHELDPFLSFELGKTTPVGSADGAELIAAFALNENSRILFGMGHQDSMVILPRLLLNSLSGNVFKLQQNPVNLVYGYRAEDTNYILGASYSHMDNKGAALSETSTGGSLGVEMGALQLFGRYQFVNAAESSGQKFTGAGAMSANVYYNLDSTTFYLTWNKSDAKASAAGTENDFHAQQVFKLGVVDSKIKDDNDYFWGLEAISSRIDCKTRFSVPCDRSFVSYKLPVWIGFESHPKNWVVLRASILQNFLLDESKDEVGYPGVVGGNGLISDYGQGVNSTLVAMGAGLKFDNYLLDGLISGSTSQKLDQTDFLTQFGLTYTF